MKKKKKEKKIKGKHKGGIVALCNGIEGNSTKLKRRKINDNMRYKNSNIKIVSCICIKHTGLRQ